MTYLCAGGRGAPDHSSYAIAPLDPAKPSSGHSTDDPEEEAALVQLEFDNRVCDCAWKLFWLDAVGKRTQYGQVQTGMM